MSAQDSEPEVVDNADDSAGDDVCAVCLDGSVYDDNDIVFCEKCNVPVHQYCYGIEHVPEGEWYCNACKAGLDPATLPCALCPFNGGAFKPTSDGRWVHVMCALYVPEVYMEHAINMEPVNISRIDSRREKLRCTICSEKSGQKVQCSKGQCRIACHPWCANHKQKGWLRHIRRDDDTETAEFQVYCPKHRNAVKEKPAAANTRTNPSMRSSRQKKRKHPGRSSTHNNRNDHRASQQGSRRSSSVTARRAIADSLLETDHESSDYDDASVAQPELQQPSADYNVCTFSEWPGQQEGEGMDLEHYWNVVAMQFPEDHTQTWLREITAPLFTLGKEDSEPLSNIPPLGLYALDSFRIAKMEETMRENFKDGSISEMINRDKFLRWLHSVVERVKLIQGFDRMAPTSPSFWEQQELEHQSAQPLPPPVSHQKGKGKKLLRRTSSEMDAVSNHGSVTDDVATIDGPPNGKVAEFDFAAHATLPPELDPYTIQIQHREGDPSIERDNTLRVAVGGNPRVLLEFEVAAKEPTRINPLATDEIVLLRNDLVCAPPMTVDDSAAVQDEPAVDLLIKRLAGIDMNQAITLPDEQIIPEIQDDEVCRALFSTTKAYLALTAACQAEIDCLMDSAIRERVATHDAQRSEWATIETRYRKMSSWKVVAECLERGIRDQLPDFNAKSGENDEIPASWHIPVPGRPKPQAEEEPEEDEEHEDAVCMVCFDGTSTDQNSIVFCDGCNMAVHQACYGILEVPDGDFFCDRCKALREMEDAYDLVSEQVANSISCCLCPRLHGGIKPTVDGQWVHLCCAIWSGSLIEDVTEMAPVNVAVPVHPSIICLPPSPVSSSSTPSTATNLPIVNVADPAIAPSDMCAVQTEIPDSGVDVGLVDGSQPIIVPEALPKLVKSKCYVCHSTAGYLAECCSESCGVHFHPLCAWFDGLLFETEVTDRTYQAQSSGGNYPSGVTFKIFCASHTPASAQSRSQQAQLVLRARYQLNENSILLAMQRRQKRQKTKRKKERDDSAAQRRGTGAVQQKELKPDTYARDKCAVCMEPSVPILDRFAKRPEEERVLTCQQCRVRVHAACYAFDADHAWQNRDLWRCDACTRGEQNPQCVLCPRRGGAFKPTVDGRWLHSYCAVHSPGSYRLGADGLVEIRSIPKESSKQKCMFCSRKTGVCARCSSGSCVHYFHALCGHINGKAFMRLRRSGRQQYCPNHVPQHITRLPTGHWLDLKEIQQLRVQFDNARTSLDLVNRREKVKKQLYAAEGDAFAAQFKSMVDRLGQGLPAEAPEAPNTPVGADGDDVPMLPKAGKRKIAKRKGERESSRLAKKEGEVVPEPEPEPDVEPGPKLVCQLAGIRLERPKAEFAPYRKRFREKYCYVRVTNSFKTRTFHQDLEETLQGYATRSRQEIERLTMETTQLLRDQARLMLDSEATTTAPTTTTTAAAKNLDQLDTTEAHDAFIFWANQDLLQKPKKDKRTTQPLEDGTAQKEKQESASERKKPTGSNKKANKTSESVETKVANSSSAKSKQKVQAGSHDTSPAAAVALPAEAADHDFAEQQPTLRAKATSKASTKGPGRPPKSTSKTAKDDSKKRRMSETVEELPEPESSAKKKDRKETSAAAEAPTQPTAPAVAAQASELKRKKHAEKQSRAFQELANDPILGGLAVFVNERGTHLEQRGFHHVLGTIEAQHPSHFADWTPAEGDDLTRLERQLQDVLDALMNYEVPVDASSTQGSHNPGNMRRSKKAAHSPLAGSVDDSSDSSDSETEEDADRKRRGVRLLCELYETAPVDVIADYSAMVRRVLDLESIRENLRLHRYTTLAAFARDVIELLNNGRRVADKNSEAWKDGDALRGLFDHLVQTVVYNGEIDESKRSPIELLDAGASLGQQLQCDRCAREYVDPGWPSIEPNIPDFRWRCPDCVHAEPAALVNHETSVYWPEDDAWYRGSVRDYDDSSQRHRILYEDQDWEFTFLPGQHFVLIPEDAGPSPEASPSTPKPATPKKTKKASAKSSSSSYPSGAKKLSKEKSTAKAKSGTKHKKLEQLNLDAENWLERDQKKPATATPSTSSKRKRREPPSDETEADGAASGHDDNVSDISTASAAHKAKAVRRSSRAAAGNA